MKKIIGKWITIGNKLYELESDENKIALSVLEPGLTIDENKNITYDPIKGKSWLGKLVKELDISRSTIIQCLDTLFDSRMLSQPLDRILEQIDDNGTKKYVRTYSISNEYQESLIQLYRLTHTINKNKENTTENQ